MNEVTKQEMFLFFKKYLFLVISFLFVIGINTNIHWAVYLPISILFAALYKRLTDGYLRDLALRWERSNHHIYTFLYTVSFMGLGLYVFIFYFQLSVGFIVSLLSLFFCWGYFIYFFLKAHQRSAEHQEILEESPGVFMGHYLDKDGLPKARHVSNSDRVQHQITVGGSGFGKTFSTFMPQIYQDIQEGDNFIVIINMKSDMDFENKVYSWCKKFNRKFRYFSITKPELSSYYNPFLFGSRGMIRDKFMLFSSWDNAFYKKLVKTDLAKKLDGLYDEGVTISKMKQLFEEYEGDKDFKGVIADLEGVQYAPFYEKINDPFGSIHDFYKEKSVFFLSLDEDQMREYAKDFQCMIYNDLRGFAGYIRDRVDERDRTPTWIYSDEIKEVFDNSMTTYNSRSRAAGFGNFYATQSPSGDIPRDLLNQLQGSCKTWHILGGLDADSIEYINKQIGTEEIVKYTEQVELGVQTTNTGLGSARDAHKHVISHNTFRRLKLGEGVLYTKEEGFSKKIIYDAMFYLDDSEPRNYTNDFYDLGIKDSIEAEKQKYVKESIKKLTKPDDGLTEQERFYRDDFVPQVTITEEGSMPF
ncbi:MAG: hypothetical protein CME70_03250 [Halobacteriovorax sp.]|nr:hypothetical protein [Halobacteriovorax sp.]